FWLKPSRLIRPPIFSLKQAKLRKRMVRKYCCLYFAVLVLFVIIIAAPAIAAKFVPADLGTKLSGAFQGLFQPRGTTINDTGKVSSWWSSDGVKITFWSFTPSDIRQYTTKNF
ncbi:hypothetical protein OXX69_007640, partial [Metschnikowia pulcherrima]